MSKVHRGSLVLDCRLQKQVQARSIHEAYTRMLAVCDINSDALMSCKPLQYSTAAMTAEGRIPSLSCVLPAAGQVAPCLSTCQQGDAWHDPVTCAFYKHETEQPTLHIDMSYSSPIIP